MNKDKAALAFAISIGLTAIMAASVATFAWFQADAQVEIQTTSETATITVQKPSEDQVDISATIHKSSNNGTTGYDSANESIGDFNFSQATSGSDLNTYNLWPGYRKTFAVKVHASKAVKVKLDLTGLTAVNDNARHVQGGNIIRIENAIKVLCSYSSSQAWVAPAGADKFTYNSTSGDASLSFPYAMATSGDNSLTDHYFFFTVEFDNNAPKYLEYKTAAYESTTENEVINTPSTTTGVNRYFKYDNTNGNHTCYEGLSFNITELTVSVV